MHQQNYPLYGSWLVRYHIMYMYVRRATLSPNQNPYPIPHPSHIIYLHFVPTQVVVLVQVDHLVGRASIHPSLQGFYLTNYLFELLLQCVNMHIHE